jgi:hypothetical protein
MELGAALTHDDVPRDNPLAAEVLDAEVLGIAGAAFLEEPTPFL